MADSDRILVITGAGASRDLGADSRHMPLMPDWASALVNELNQAESGLAAAIGLRSEMPGDEFERVLGEFLAFKAQALVLLQQFRSLGFSNLQTGGDVGMTQWHQLADRRADDVIEMIRQNLFASFGYMRFDDGLAYQAYEGLYKLLAAGDNSLHLAFATTNYDSTLEAAFSSYNDAGTIGGITWRVEDGFPRRGLTTPELNARGIAREWLQANNVLPVLHLHGAVGWYEKNGRIVRHSYDQGYNASLGVPALLLPDATKTITSFGGGEGLWAEFQDLLRSASHILFLGHSLHDDHLVSLVKDLAQGHVGVCWLPDDATMQVSEEAKTYIRELLPDAHVIPARFGPRPLVLSASFQQWRLGLVSG